MPRDEAPRPSRPKGRSLGGLAEEWGIPPDIDPAEYHIEQESAIKSKLPKDFKRWYNSTNIAEARKEYMKILGRDTGSRLQHTTSKTATNFKISGDTKPGKFEQWHLDFLLLLQGRQALSREFLGASFLSGHQHLCCHQIVRPKYRKVFDEWAAKEAPELVGAHRLMLGKDGKLLPIGRMDPWKNQQTEQLDTAVSTYVIATTSASDEIADEDSRTRQWPR